MTEQVRDRLERQGSRPRPLSGLMTHRLKVTKRSDPPRTATVPSNKHPITAEIQADISAQLVPPRTATGTPRGRAAESTAHKPRAAKTCGRSGCRTKDNRRKEPGRPPPPPPPHANPSFSNRNPPPPPLTPPQPIYPLKDSCYRACLDSKTASTTEDIHASNRFLQIWQQQTRLP